MAEQRKQRTCKACAKKVLAIRPRANHLLHFFISLFTAGFWIPIWIFTAIQIGGWKCPSCGGKC